MDTAPFGRKAALRFSVIALALCFALTPPAAAQNVLENGSFEVDAYGAGLPISFGQWSGTPAEIVGAEQGITPLDGTSMLRFLYTDLNGPSASGFSCDVLQLVDMSPWQPSVRAGNVTVTAEVKVNRVAGAGVDDQFWLMLWAYRGDPADFPTQVGAWVGMAELNLETDADPATWETLSLSLPLRSITDYVAVYIFAAENITPNGPPDEEFEGHYADAAVLRVEGGVPTEAPSFGAIKSLYRR